MKTSEARRAIRAAGFTLSRSGNNTEDWTNGKDIVRFGKSTTMAPAEISKIRAVLRRAIPTKQKVFSPHQAIVGVRVRTLIDFLEVPKGSTGIIDEVYLTGFFVKWDLHQSIRDRFDAKTELRFLERIQ